jgi:hypothetical protein
MSKAYFADQLSRDQDQSDEVNYAPADTEPKLNCWIDVEGETPDGPEMISYMFVDGAYVRDHVFVDYVEGGHFYRYGWIPEAQVWLEDEMSLVDRLCTGVHETHERFRMKYLGWSYERAHMSACVIERKLRALTLVEGIVIPTSDSVKEIFALEASGEDCERLARELMEKEVSKVEAANNQSNFSVGRNE